MRPMCAGPEFDSRWDYIDWECKALLVPSHPRKWFREPKIVFPRQTCWAHLWVSSAFNEADSLQTWDKEQNLYRLPAEHPSHMCRTRIRVSVGLYQVVDDCSWEMILLLKLLWRSNVGRTLTWYGFSTFQLSLFTWIAGSLNNESRDSAMPRIFREFRWNWKFQLPLASISHLSGRWMGNFDRKCDGYTKCQVRINYVHRTFATDNQNSTSRDVRITRSQEEVHTG